MSTIERSLYRIINVVVRLLLRSPLHPLLSGSVVLLTLRGRRTGWRYTVPVSYIHEGDHLICFTGGVWSAWWRNLLAGAPVSVRLRGRELPGEARAITDGVVIVPPLTTFLRRFPRTARRFGITVGPDNQPDVDMVARAARRGRAVMIEVRLGRPAA
ncbi:MAG: nitroreductase family deazaflavin-dependent oxidoreductase [Chloroflexota bacterium]|nr:nitroreductase family deazaflavin-dependent oxidoreductase [Chloroflexota bacterium]